MIKIVIKEAFEDMIQSGKQAISQHWEPESKQKLNQSATTTAPKQVKGTSAVKGGGRVQPKASIIDVRRATYGKMMLALQAAGITDQNQQKQYAEQIITNIIIPFLTFHLNARGLNVTDLRSKKTSLSSNPTKDQSGNPRVITLSEQTDQELKDAEFFLETHQQIEEVPVTPRSRSFKDFFHQYLNSVLIFTNPELFSHDAYELKSFLDFFTKPELKFVIDKVNNTKFLDNKNKKQLLKLINIFNTVKDQINEKDIKRYLLDNKFIDTLVEDAKNEINKIKKAKEIIANVKGKTTKGNSEIEQEEDVEDPPTNPGQETQSLKNYRSQLEKLDSKVFPKELGKNPVLILSKLFAANPELAKQFGFNQNIEEAITRFNQPLKLLKALKKQGINIDMPKAVTLTRRIMSLNSKKIKSTKQVSKDTNQNTKQQPTSVNTSQNQSQTQQSNQQNTQQQIKKPAITQTKGQEVIEIIHLFKGSSSLLNQINNFLKNKNVNISSNGFQEKIMEIIKDITAQLKFNGISNKEIQENFDFTKEILNEELTNRWKLLANIK